MRGPLAFCLFAAGALLLLTAVPQIDLGFSALFWRPGKGFYLADWPPVQTLYRSAPYVTGALILFLLAALVLPLLGGPRLLGADRRAALYLLLALALGPGLVINTGFKDHWGRARPTQIVEFGGTHRFTPALVPSRECERNCSFSSGHAGLGFYFVSFAFLAPPGRRRGGEVAALALGAFYGIGRIAQGGHFLSDVVVSGLIVYAVSWLLHRAFIAHEPAEWLQRLADGVAASRPRQLAALLAASAVAIPLSYFFVDRPAAYFFHAQAEWLHAVFQFITRFGVGTFWLVGSGLLFLALYAASRLQRFAPLRQRLAAYACLPLFFFISVALPGLLVDLLKGIFGRARPKLLFQDREYGFTWWGRNADYWSFPSGHTANAVAIALALGAIWPRFRPLFWLFALLVAASRVIISAHYVGDVMMGAVIAAALVPYIGFVFHQCGIDLAEARQGALTPRPALPWRARLGLDRLARHGRAPLSNP
jgi:lipid A 4'-phosphatase